jgi:hypothetical protein
MRLPAATYRHGHNHDQRGSNAGVSPHCFTAHPVMGVKPVTVHTLPCTVYRQSPSREDTTRPVFRDLGDSALSVRLRPGLDPASTLSAVRRARHKSKTKCQQAKAPNSEINVSSNHPCTLFSLLETWARRPLSQACNPYASTSVQENTKLSPRWT